MVEYDDDDESREYYQDTPFKTVDELYSDIINKYKHENLSIIVSDALYEGYLEKGEIFIFDNR